MFTIPQSYKEGMEEIVLWSNSLSEDVAKRFMLDVYKMFIEWKYILETSQIEKEDNNG